MRESRTGRSTSLASFGKLTCLIVMAVVAGTQKANCAEPDLQLWLPTQFIHPFSKSLSVSIQTEARLQDNISEMSELVYKPALNYHLNETWAFSAGYKYIDKFHDANEQDVWQECHFNKKIDDLLSGFQVRLEERFIDDLSGVVPRLRLLQHVSHPIGESSFYLTGFGAVRFNLDDKGQGPVSGFEQSRIYTGLGKYIGAHTIFEAGYIFRYEETRDRADKNDHALNFQLVFNTQAKHIKKPSSRDRYR